MSFLEKDLEDIIYESDNESLMERGLYIYGNKLRQIKLGNYGICDLIFYKKSFDNSFIINVFELKKGVVNSDTFLQSLRYVRGIQDFLGIKYPNILNNCRFNIYLIGKSIDKQSPICYMPSIFENVSLYTYKYEIDGIKFKYESGYALIENGFKL